MGKELEIGIKDISGIALGNFILQCCSLIPQDLMDKLLINYIEKLRTESTRIHTLKALNLVFKSLGKCGNHKLLNELISEVSLLIRQRVRRVRVLSL